MKHKNTPNFLIISTILTLLRPLLFGLYEKSVAWPVHTTLFSSFSFLNVLCTQKERLTKFLAMTEVLSHPPHCLFPIHLRQWLQISVPQAFVTLVQIRFVLFLNDFSTIRALFWRQIFEKICNFFHRYIPFHSVRCFVNHIVL